ncbi:2-dehydro-3-deoxyphosphogluconate aldolase / (4S)-4-hydroxy-2-oxoglutarate aldolase [Raineyella antarctica]|uniref:2-dehydro-3-deoxyphosphogluconate aldolase / (4S)-4-hydroxy-2-oxoglutarate aldolase n=1 Tax=Raineyella antarctica TaxID=1577474 RepID=A0A1G6HFX8_9ACTN|nr:aldolase [Raineyella antarctica]SDB93152.1 2-dehydro-3-deoxyphosphogluconate aldolase / (4S)-4-hydroxy-2-oxoglutarate aldolase [Raineyella antarctica]
MEQAAEAGATFIVSPGLDAAIVDRARRLGLDILPGAATPTEIMLALSLGLTTAKFFPAGVYGGPAAIKALSAPFGTLAFVPTGGVGPDNLADYLALACVPAVGGSWMVPPAAIAAGDFAGIAELTRSAVDAACATV